MITRITKNGLSLKLVATAASFGMCFLVLAPTASAAAQVDIGQPLAETFGLPATDLRTIIANLIRTLLGFVGMVMVLMILWSGFKYMTHGGNEDKRHEAIAGIKNAIIGLIIMLTSYSMADFVIEAVTNATGAA